jgi:hypothetical protein
MNFKFLSQTPIALENGSLQHSIVAKIVSPVVTTKTGKLVCNVEHNGSTLSALVNEVNFRSGDAKFNFSVGTSVLTNVVYTPGQPNLLISVSGLPQGERVEAAQFANLFQVTTPVVEDVPMEEEDAF